ncbi:NAD-dependent protein deacetylase hst2-1 [Hypsizygus marmoreus]|uniref:NAD-dependent protein deacetylase hst2-1 n=1 Tax=Hypsizygus marmoreus TaxID=39966 RepID=A0A369IXY0_HYPMA|nr:NAD-dependent protein deacetylase hst2-1 [Hypsizygus marmoreus]
MGNNPKMKSPARQAKEATETPKEAQAPTSKKPESKRSQDIRKLAKYISSGKCKKVVLMLGAGVSTSAGIPDFRSPKTGLYSNLQRLNLPYPEAVFEINFFRRNPVPFYTLASELYPGSFRPTLTHSFVKLLASRQLLHVCFTQNIDTLERRAGVPPEKIVEAHGSFATQRCVDCGTPFPDEEMKKIVLGDRLEGNGNGNGKEMKIPRCLRKGCGGLVKPDIVFFGEALPDRFIEHIPTVGDSDLLLIIGTSLTVYPFASLAEMADRRRCQRVLINIDRVGDLGRRPSDTVLLGECDEIVRELCEELGWGEELERVWEETAMEGKEEERKPAEEEAEEARRAEALEKEVERITEAIEKRLKLEKEEEEALAKRVEEAIQRRPQVEEERKEEEEEEEAALEREVERITEAIQKRLELQEEGKLIVTEVPGDLEDGREVEVRESKEVEEVTDAFGEQLKLEDNKPVETTPALASESEPHDLVPKGEINAEMESGIVQNQASKSSGGKL